PKLGSRDERRARGLVRPPFVRLTRSEFVRQFSFFDRGSHPAHEFVSTLFVFCSPTWPCPFRPEPEQRIALPRHVPGSSRHYTRATAIHRAAWQRRAASGRFVHAR